MAALPFRRAAVLSTGTEIVQGLYADTNAQFLASQLTALGIGVVMTAAVPDDPAQLENILRSVMQQADLVVCSGGLGPTEDDINRGVFAKVLGAELVRDEEAAGRMRARFAARGYGKMPESNEIQAMIPAGAVVLQNDWGTAPGFFAESGELALLALPGPPKEMAPMFTERALPLLRERTCGETCVVTRTVHTFGRPESDLNEKTRELFHRDPKVAFTILARNFGVDFRIVARGSSRGETAALIQEFEDRVRDCVGAQDVFGADEETIESVVAGLLLSCGQTVSAAESCTGGLVAKMLTDTPGSSAYLHQSFVTYSDYAKQLVLGVKGSTLAEFGAVSKQTAHEMAENVRVLSKADWGIGITGIAGPSGATAEKPVGLTFIALACSKGVWAERFRFLGSREQNRAQTAMWALNMLRKALLGFAAVECFG